MADSKAFSITPDLVTGNPIAIVAVTNANADHVDQQIVTIGDATDGTLHAAVTANGLKVEATIPGTVAVSVANFPATQPVSGTVVVTSVGVSNFPATQAVSGTLTVTQATAANLNATVAQGAAGASAWLISGAVVATGTVALGTASATIGQIALVTGSAVIGAVTQSGSPWTINGTVSLATAAATIGQVVLATGTAAIGTVTQGAAGASAWLISGAVTMTGTAVLATGTAAIGTVAQGTAGASAWLVDGSAITQPVSQGTSPWAESAVDASGSIEEASRRMLRMIENSAMDLLAAGCAGTNHFAISDGSRSAATDHY